MTDRHADAGQPAPPIASLRLQGRVPFIATWSGETFSSPRLVWRGGRVAYANERKGDRDAFGVLWRRAASRPGSGRPEYGRVHPGRQRRAMGGLLCQVCGRPARPEATDDGVLFLLSREEYEQDPWPAPISTTHPPLCLRCAAVSVGVCPHLRGHYVAIRCPAPRLYGVNGIVHLAGIGATPVRNHADPIQIVSYASPRRGLVHAAQAVMRLDHYTVADLDSEPAALLS